jgi:hypothetical protein
MGFYPGIPDSSSIYHIDRLYYSPQGSDRMTSRSFFRLSRALIVFNRTNGGAWAACPCRPCKSTVDRWGEGTQQEKDHWLMMANVLRDDPSHLHNLVLCLVLGQGQDCDSLVRRRGVRSPRWYSTEYGVEGVSNAHHAGIVHPLPLSRQHKVLGLTPLIGPRHACR